MEQRRKGRGPILTLGLITALGAVLLGWNLFGGAPMVREFRKARWESSTCQVSADAAAQHFVPIGSTEAHARRTIVGQGFRLYTEIPRAHYAHKDSDSAVGGTRRVWSSFPFGDEYRIVAYFKKDSATHVNGYIFCQHL